MSVQLNSLSRRHFLAGSGLVIGLALTPRGMARTLIQGDQGGSPKNAQQLNAFVHVAPDNTVTVLSKHLEMGQGPYTGLTQLVAEEMDADWSQMRVKAAPADDEKYANLAFGIQGTGGSSSISNSWEQLRRAGATAKAMLVNAAAASWQVPANEIRVDKGKIVHEASGKTGTFGEFADQAALLQPPTKVTLKAADEFSIIGESVQRLDTPEKTDGKAVFTLDVMLENMLTAVVAHPDYFGAKVKSFNADGAKKVPGVVDVQVIEQGVAVYAENTYAALKGRDALKIEWDLSGAERRSSKQIIDDYRKLISSNEGLEATNDGDVKKAFGADGVTTLEAEYVFPYLAHAPMEPLDAVLVKNDDGTIDCYNGAQFPGGDAEAIAEVCGVKRSKVRVNVQLAGGSFGRRAQFGSPYMREAAAVFKASGMQRPVRHMWTREDDIKGGFYRPIFVHKLKGSLDNSGKITGWDQVIAGQSIMQKKDLDESSVEGASNLPYAIDNLRVYSYNTESKVPVLWWRSVGHTHTAFAVESFIDELLEKAGKDPVQGRLALLQEHPRERAVLKEAAKMAQQAGDPPDGRARGVAVHKSFNTYVAEIAEVSAKKDGQPRVHRVWVAVDCGVAVNPNHIRAQIEGGVGFGLGAVLFDEITLADDGRVEQSNFHDYPSLRIHEMPHVEVSIIQSDNSPTGVGEPGVPPIGPAVANAWRRLTGKPVRNLPMVSRQQA